MPPPPLSEGPSAMNNQQQQQQRQAQFQRQEQQPPPQQQSQQTAAGGQAVQQQQQQQQQHVAAGTQQHQQYSIPGILHYLQYEWQRFELERQQWTVERAELQARISLLQGERKGQENLKSDLIRRIKMLEFCLRQERAKFHKLKFGVDLPSAGNQPEDENLNEDAVNEPDPLTNNNIGEADASGLNWKQGRQLLRQYLQEIGYTDTIIDVRSNRVRSLLGLNNSLTSGLDDPANISADQQTSKSVSNQMKSGTGTQVRRTNQSNATAGLVADTEASVLATFEFLNDQRDGSGGRGGVEDDDDVDDEEDMVEELDGGRSSFPMDVETEEVMAEFDFLNAHQQNVGQKDVNWRNRIPDIGELATLTMNNESDMNGGSATNTSLQNSLNNDFRKTWNPKYTLKSHFDCIRSLCFHASEPLLVTCSEDETLKLWNLNKTQQTSKAGKQQTQTASGTTFDLEPVYTFRGHTSRVLSLCLRDNTIFSGAQNGELFSWKIPDNTSSIDPYDTYDPSLSHSAFDSGHSDAIWSLVSFDSRSGAALLCSASADSTIKIWDANSRECIKSITCEDPRSHPTCIVSISTNKNNNSICATTGSLIVVSFTDGSIAIYDVDSSSDQPVSTFENGNSSRINSIVVHPTMPVIVSAHEDRQIKFWDMDNGKCLHAMVAHLDEVTCLACDPNGLYLLSGSHDCSVRLWNFDNRTCVQEITSHRKKFDEAIFDVSFHPSKAFFASAGADGLAKVFV